MLNEDTVSHDALHQPFASENVQQNLPSLMQRLHEKKRVGVQRERINETVIMRIALPYAESNSNAHAISKIQIARPITPHEKQAVAEFALPWPLFGTARDQIAQMPS